MIDNKQQKATFLAGKHRSAVRFRKQRTTNGSSYMVVSGSRSDNRLKLLIHQHGCRSIVSLPSKAMGGLIHGNGARSPRWSSPPRAISGNRNNPSFPRKAASQCPALAQGHRAIQSFHSPHPAAWVRKLLDTIIRRIHRYDRPRGFPGFCNQNPSSCDSIYKPLENEIYG
jgi:hypothetical protein